MKTKRLSPIDTLKITLILIVLPAMVTWADSTRETVSRHVFDLNDLYRMALETSEQIKTVEEDLHVAELDKVRALSVIIPRLSLFGDYSRYNDPDPTFPETLTYGVQLNQSFTVNGRELTALKISNDIIRQKELNLLHTKEAYLFEVANAYYNILRAQKALDISNADVKRLSNHKDAVKSRFDLGEVTKTAMIRADAELSGSRSVVVKAENALKIARYGIARLVTLPTDFCIKDGNHDSDNTAIALDTAIDTATSARSDLLSVKEAVSAAEKQITWSHGAYFPILSLEGKYFDMESKWDDVDPMTKTDHFEADKFTILGQLTFTVFDGGLRKAELNQARARLRQAKLLYESEKKAVIFQVQTAWLDLVTQKSILESLGDQLKFAEENYYAVTEQFAVGLSNSIDVMDANTLLVKAQRELSDAHFLTILATLNLEKTMGTFMHRLKDDI